MLTQKPCKWCGSIWHSKNKCTKRPQEALPDGFLQKRTHTPLSLQKPSERLRTRHSDKTERARLTKKADIAFSLHIRQRGSDGTWNWCYTCGVKLLWQELQCGHFMGRRYINTRWDEVNCNPQCNDCNVVKSGNLVIYEKKLRAQHGDEAINELKQRARSGNKVLRAEIQEVIDNYRVVF